jgi:hypothetical protein
MCSNCSASVNLLKANLINKKKTSFIIFFAVISLFQNDYYSCSNIVDQCCKPLNFKLNFPKMVSSDDYSFINFKFLMSMLSCAVTF